MKYGYAWEINFPENSFNITTMWHVFEHIAYPNELLQKIHGYMEPKGILIIAIPNSDSLNFHLMHTEDIPRHLFIYNKSSISALLEKNHFKVIDLNYDSKAHCNSVSCLLSFILKRKIFKLDEEELLYYYHNKPLEFETKILKIVDRMATFPLKYILPYIKMCQNFVIIAQKQ